MKKKKKIDNSVVESLFSFYMTGCCKKIEVRRDNAKSKTKILGNYKADRKNL